MIKKWIYYTSIVTIVAFTSVGFNTIQNQNQDWFYVTNEEDTPSLFPSEKVNDYPVSNILFTGKSFVGFKEAVAFRESQGKYTLINSFGYMGKYQFGRSALRAIGIKNTLQFLNNPDLQEEAFIALLAKNKWELRYEIEKFEGKIINSTTITESGLLAAAHLCGAGSVKKYLRYNGKRHIRDGFGTSLRSYIQKFGGYDTSFIEADADASISEIQAD
jgi:hypothetical protein